MLRPSRNINFKSTQEAFSAYIRDPQNNPPPADTSLQRMLMYRELFFNNIEGFLSGNFPVLRKILSDTNWLDMVQDFFLKHSCKSPHFSKVPEEFLHYLNNERDCSKDFPFILELAHYEWVEMALSIAKHDPTIYNLDSFNLLNASVTLSPLAWLLAYQYPVHKIGPSFLPDEAPDLPTFLIVYRDKDDNVNFIEITPITYRLLEIILEQNRPLLVKECLNQVAKESNHPNSEIVVSGGLQILKELVEKTIINLV